MEVGSKAMRRAEAEFKHAQFTRYSREAIENTADRLGVDPVALAEESQSGIVLARLINIAIDHAPENTACQIIAALKRQSRS